jgi:hypothetical protein
MESVTRWVKVECPDGRIVRREFEIEPQKGDNGGAFLAGAGIVGLFALVHNASKDERHKQELQQVYWQGYQQCESEMAQALSLKQGQLNHLADLLGQKTSELAKKDAEIARLNAVVQNQASTLKWQQLQLTARVFLADDEDGISPN